ncbi:S-adenosyl-methyltransferase MraW [Candidatus Uzinura diaspidicola str. ASNER]|uniref:Ribosomal RNA small subunit methyltransferase H n=1 Tax=Candidatus Uzinura diaspidicola str. ASNER TaxID=1133592 RepID=L7VFU8_9FLAO|nr:S-adenosyl-methyltransferase MraW [Candidatus Uzinura diaspidicola str. ASNER]
MQKIIQNFHKPVFLREVVEGIVTTSRQDVYVDVTYGGGGHSAGLLKKLAPEATLLAFDLDQSSIANNPLQDNRLKIFNRNFRYIENILRIQGIFKISGIIADLGVSSHQLDTPDRGFSIRYNQPLDMRMDKRVKKYAKAIINSYSQESLAKIFFYYGELRNSRKLAKTIVFRRKEKTIENTFELIEIIKNDIEGRNKQKFFAKVFQSLRIEVNEELSSLKYLLKSVINIIRKEGRIAIISYHSLEDRIVKQFLRNGRFENIPLEDTFGKKKIPFLLLHRKAISPGKEEIQKNPRSRSASLRIAKKNR